MRVVNYFVRHHLVLGTSTAGTRAPAPASVQTYTGTLYDGETGTLELRLQGGVRYYYDGVCDGDCTDLDFALQQWVPAYNGRRGYWRFVVADRRPDDTPGIVVTPASGGSFRLSIIMARCYVEPCDYNVELTW